MDAKSRRNNDMRPHTVSNMRSFLFLLVTELNFLCGLGGIFLAETADAVALHPVDDVTAKMLTIDFPVGFQVLTGRHEEALLRIVMEERETNK